MKKSIGFLFAIMYMLLFSILAKAQILSPFISTNQSYTASLTIGNGIMYILTTEDKLYELADLNATPKEVEFSVPQPASFYTILSDGRKLYGLSYDRNVYLQQDSTSGSRIFNKSIPLQLPEFLNIQYYDGIVDGNILYLLYGDGESTAASAQLVICNAEENEQRIVPAPNIREICGYRQNKLLVLVDDPSSWGKSVLQTFDTISGVQKELIALPQGMVSGIAYDESADIIYCAMGGIIYRSAALSPFEECGVLPVSAYSVMGSVLFYGKYSFFDSTGVYLCDVNIDMTNSPVLTISGGASQDAKAAFQKLFPDVIVKELPYLPTQQDMAINMLTQNYAADIYSVPITLGYFPQLKAKGFYADLSQSALLLEEAKKMLPQLSDALWHDNQLCAFPVWAHGRLLSYNKTLWMEMGFTEQDLPGDILEFIDFIIKWMDEYSSQYPDVILYQPVLTAKQQLYGWAIGRYILSYEPDGHKPYFDVQLLTDVFAKIDEAESIFDEIDRQNAVASKQDNMSEFLFDFEGIMLSSEATYQDWSPLLLTIDKNASPHEVVQISVLVINPYSKYIDLALSFLECAAGTLDAQTRVFMYGDETMAEEREDFKEYREQYLDKKKQLEEAMKNAPPEKKKEYEDNLAALNSEYSWNEINNRWVVHPDTIKRYKELVPFLSPSGENNLLITMYNSSRSLFARYDNGQITSETFLKELERIFHMHWSE